LRITAFFDSCLDAPLRNSRWSWGAVSRDERKVYLRVWKEQIASLDGARHVKVLRGDNTKQGYRERERHLQRIKEGAEVWCVLCRHKPPGAGSRIASFDRTPIRAQLIDRDGSAWLRLES